MITTLAVQSYRSLRDLVMPLSGLTVVTGANGTGKSNLYKAFHLLADTSQGRLISSLAQAGGLSSVLWAGPETISRAMRMGEAPVQGTGSRRAPISLQMGFASDEMGYLVDVGLPPPNRSTMFERDPQIKREAIFAGELMRPATTVLSRPRGLDPRTSMLTELADAQAHPEVLSVRDQIRGWRFYDAFRTDPASPSRAPQVGTWTPILDHDGVLLAPALQTILESAWAGQVQEAVAQAFDGAGVGVVENDGWLQVQLHQRGMLRPLSAAEISDGTLRFLLLATALLSPQPPSLLVLNEPETSLHPDVIPAVAALVKGAAERCQTLVITHSDALVAALGSDDVLHHELVKDVGETRIAGQGMINAAPWRWGSR